MKHGIKIRNLNWSYGSEKILKQLNLDIQPGKFTGIIGPNGSGKTTLLRSISASLRPQKGSVLIDGRDVLTFTAKEIARAMALVPQSTHMEFDFSVEDIVLMGRHPYLKRFQQEGEADIEIAREAMRMTGVLPLKNRSITELSGGERQRAIVARALAQQSEIILLDEPISNLDIKHQVEILRIVKSLVQERQITVICVLHDLNLAAYYCDHLILLSNGQVYKEGSALEVLNPETIREVYGLKVNVMRHPGTGIPYVIPDYEQG